MSKTKERLDIILSERGMVSSRNRGQVIIMAGEVKVNGETVFKPGALVERDADIEIVAPMPYVSRGGFKLAEALQIFELSVAGMVCADVGACTGGFTDVLLQNGAGRVYAIDVGYGQLDWKLRQDPRVVILERTNARYLESLPEIVDLVAIDVSFISLRLILPAVSGWIHEGSHIIALIKPQFEAGPQHVSNAGIVRDPLIHAAVLREVVEFALHNDLATVQIVKSPTLGKNKNQEFLSWLRPRKSSQVDIEALSAVALQ